MQSNQFVKDTADQHHHIDILIKHYVIDIFRYIIFYLIEFYSYSHGKYSKIDKMRHLIYEKTTKNSPQGLKHRKGMPHENLFLHANNA